MKRYITYCMVLFAMLFANCTTTTEGLDEAEVLTISIGNGDNNNIEIECDGGQAPTIEVNSICDWKLSSTESWSWITPNTKTGKGNTEIKLNVAENTTVDVRTATVNISNLLYGISKDISITQKAGQPFINVAKSDISMKSESAIQTVTIESNVDYSISSSESWCKLDSYSGSKGTKSLKITVDKSPVTTERTAVVKVVNKDKNITKEIKVSQAAFEPYLTVDTPAISTICEGTKRYVSIVGNISWTATCDADWVTFTPANANEGSATLNVVIAKNEATTSRAATIKIANSQYGIEKEIEVTQSAFGPSLDVNTTAISAVVEGVTKDVTIEGNISWSATCDADWVTLTPANANAGSATLNVVIAKNEATTSRAATIKIANSQYGIEKEINITQEAFGPSLDVNTTVISAAVEGVTKGVTIESNISWSATCDADWVTFTPANANAGSATLNVVIAKNEAATSRTATIKIANSQYGIEKEIEVTQSAFGPELVVSETAISATCASEVKQVAITSNISWSATCEADWVSLSPANGTGSATLQVTIPANSTTQSRSTVVWVVSEEYGITKEIAVNQVAFTPELSVLDNTTLNLSFGAGEEIVDVNANVDYTRSTNVDWINVSKTNSGIKVKYTTNNDANSRSGQIVLSNEQYQLNVVISVVQAAFPSDNVIYYTTTDGGIAILGNSLFGEAKVLSVTNEGGVGIVRFDAPVTTISDNAFNGSTNLKTVTIPGSVTSIGDSAFRGCSALSSVTIPESVTSIGDSAFRECSALASVTIPESVTSIGSYAFRECSALASVEIPEGVTSIESYAFYDCDALASVEIPESVTSIGSSAFYYCSALTSVTIPESVISIGSSAFSYCSALTSVSIPESVTSIGSSAFYGCSKLSSVYCSPTTPPTGGSSMFNSNASGRKIYVRPESLSAYRSASYWSNYSSYINIVPYTVTECTSLVITADDVDWYDTTTTIHYTATVNATSMFGNHIGIEETGTATSSSFEQNTSSSAKTITISYTYLGRTDYTTITQGKKAGTYTITLNSQWKKSSSVSNPDSSLYDGVYESYSNYNMNSSTATMYIDIDGYSEFTIYVRSDSGTESSYDYVKVSELDSTTVKASTKGVQSSGTSISSYTKVTYSNISSGSHRIIVQYVKDTVYHSGADCGYLIIPKNQ